MKSTNFDFSIVIGAKAPEKIGLAPVEFLGHASMKPFQYSQVLSDKPKKMNKDEKEYQEKDYIPLYTFALPAKVGFNLLLVVLLLFVQNYNFV